MVLAAALAASFVLSDVATAAPAKKASKSMDAGKAVHAGKPPGRRDAAPFGRMWGRRDQQRFSGSPSRAKGPRGLDAASARELSRRRSSKRDLVPAELQAGFEAWLRESLAEELARSLGQPAAAPRGTLDRITWGLVSTAVARSVGPTSPAPGFSTTNLQEAGVDESDSIKFDGEFLYIAPTGSRAVRGVEEPEPVAIRVLRATDDPAQAVEIGEIEIPGTSAVIGMYLLGDAEQGDVRLLVVGSARQRSAFEIPWTNPWDWGGSRTTLHLFDVNDPAEARERWSLVIEGQLVATRRVEEKLHLVTRATPVYKPVDPLLETEEALLQAREMVTRAREAELLPRVVMGGGAPEPLVTVRRCLLPVADANEIPRTPRLLTVTSLDLRNPRRRASVCMGGMAAELYSSTQSLYLTARSAGITVIHKFAYTDRGPQYRGVGRVKGSLAGAERGFSLGEHDGVLGVVTDVHSFGWNFLIGTLPSPISIAPPGGISLPPSPRPAPGTPIRIIGPTPIPVPHEDPPGEPDLGRYRLTLLRESRERDLVLEEVSHIPHEEQPEPIGKPGDFIHGVRFMGERLYVVTYRKVDPLYAIDLSDPEMPRIAGQLQVPGFSDYLHPIGSDLLLGIGFDTLPDVRNDWFQGIKVELFDVSDPAELESLDVIAVGRRGSQSAALRDHHVISHLPAGPDGFHRFAVPIQVHDREVRSDDRPTTRFPWLHTGLYLFEVEEASSGAAAQLREVGAVIAAEAGEGATSSGQYTGGDRSVIQGAAVHYVHGRQVWSAPWDAPEEAVGPQ